MAGIMVKPTKAEGFHRVLVMRVRKHNIAALRQHSTLGDAPAGFERCISIETSLMEPAQASFGCIAKPSRNERARVKSEGCA